MRLSVLLRAGLLALLVLGAAEGMLRLVPLERWEPPFAGKSRYPIFVPGEGGLSGRLVTNVHFRSFLNPQSFALKKPAGVFRVFVLGGSAAFGWPYGDEYGFTGYLRRALEAAAPGRFEIVNASGMSYGSHRVLDFLREIVTHDPDLVVIYTGNNEYVERNALPRDPAASGFLRGSREIVRGSRVYRAVRLAIYRLRPGMLAATSGADLTDIRARAVTRGMAERSPEVDARIFENYRSNLAEMVRVLQARGIPGIFCTVPVNLADWPPASAAPAFADAESARRWRKEIEKTRALLRSGDVAPLLERSASALALAPEDPLTTYLWAKAQFAAGNYSAASEAFGRARDQDPGVIRATGSQNAVVRGLASPGEGIHVADLERRLADASPGGVPGANLVVDYVHPTLEGHRLIAEALLPAIATLSQHAEALDAARLALREDRSGVADPELVASGRYAQALTLQANERWEEAAAVYREVLGLTPLMAEAWAGLAGMSIRTGAAPRTIRDLFERALQIEPRNGPILAQYGFYLFSAGDHELAQRYLQRALAEHPLLPAAEACLGIMAQERGESREAIRRFETALAQGHETAEMQAAWGSACLALGQVELAGQHGRRALSLDPLAAEWRSRDIPGVHGKDAPP